jgi:hypothetical protein
MPVFLFSYTNRKLHGIFKAVSEGGTYNPQGTLLFWTLLTYTFALFGDMPNLSAR